MTVRGGMTINSSFRYSLAESAEIPRLYDAENLASVSHNTTLLYSPNPMHYLQLSFLDPSISYSDDIFQHYIMDKINFLKFIELCFQTVVPGCEYNDYQYIKVIADRLEAANVGKMCQGSFSFL